jgi:hypothetical protein
LDRLGEPVGMDFKSKITPVETEFGDAGILHRRGGGMLDGMAVNGAVTSSSINRCVARL